MAGVTTQREGEGDAPDLAELRRRIDNFTTTTEAGRIDSTLSIDYYDGRQLSPSVRAALKRRKQPDIVINRLRVSINGILGVTQRGKSQPRAYPRTPKDEASADVATDALRYAAEKARFAATKLDVFKDMLVPGTGAVLVGCDEDQNITLEQIRWEEFVYDERSRRPDFADAHWGGICKWMFVDDAKLRWPKKATELESACSAWGSSGLPDLTLRDRPSNGAWADLKRRRLMVVEMYYLNAGRWMRTVFTHDLELEHGESPYLDEKKRPVCPIEAQSAYVDRENNRYGAAKDMRDVQDEVNQRRSKGLHLINARQIQEVGPGTGQGSIEDARKEAARPDGVLPSGWQFVPGNLQAAAQNLEMLQEAKAELERMSPNPAILGRGGEDASGRALLARQQAGLVELAVLYGGLEDWELRVYRQVWARMKQYWTAPMWIRVTDDEGSPQFVGLNQPKGEPVMDPQTGQQAEHPDTGEPMEGQPQYHPPVRQDPFSGQMVPHPQAGQPVLGYKNAVGEMDVDIIVDTTPDTATLQQEQYQDLLQLVSASPIYQQQVPLSALIKLSGMAHKKEVLDSLNEGQQAGGQQAQQQQQVQQQMAVENHQASLAETASKIRLNTANANKSQVEAEVKGAQGLLTAHTQGVDDGTHAPHQHNQLSQPEEVAGAE